MSLAQAKACGYHLDRVIGYHKEYKMTIITDEITLNTRGFCDIIDITPQVSQKIKTSGIKNGIVTLFVPGSTGAITTIEYESGVVNDLKDAIERIAPQNIPYKHDARWGDGNGFSHVRAALVGASFSVPVKAGKPTLGTWQQIVLIDFDNRSRKRNIMVQIIGE